MTYEKIDGANDPFLDLSALGYPDNTKIKCRVRVTGVVLVSPH